MTHRFTGQSYGKFWFRRLSQGINPANYYSWKKAFMEAGKERLTRNTVRDATRHEIEHLKREHGD